MYYDIASNYNMWMCPSYLGDEFSSLMQECKNCDGTATVTMALCVGYLHEMIEGINSYKPEVKASKSDKRLRSYGHSKFCTFSY